MREVVCLAVRTQNESGHSGRGCIVSSGGLVLKEMEKRQG